MTRWRSFDAHPFHLQLDEKQERSEKKGLSSEA